MRPVTVLILLAASAAECGTPVGWLEHAREIVASRNADRSGSSVASVEANAYA